MAGTSDENSCRIDRRADYQGSRPPVDLQAGVEKMVTGSSPSVVHQADGGAEATGSGLEGQSTGLAQQSTPDASTPNPTPLTNSEAPENSSSQYYFNTLEPYSNPTFRGRGGFRGRGRNNQRRNYPEYPPLIKETNHDHKRFFLIQSSESRELWKEIDTLVANKELEKCLKGTPSKVTELRNGDLLVQVTNADQSQRIRQLKTLDGCTVSVEAHKHLNYTKGTIHSKRFCKREEDVLLEELASSNVVSLYKMQKRIEGDLQPTGTMILTFDSCYVPQTVKLGWTSLEVREYTPDPRRCYNCQKFSHSSKACREPEERCANCGEWGHNNSSCQNPPRCCNCEGAQGHAASDKKCPVYLQEKEILALVAKEKLSYSEARKKLGIPFKRKPTYAKIVSSNNRMNNEPITENNKKRERSNSDSSESKRRNTLKPAKNPQIPLSLQPCLDKRESLAGQTASPPATPVAEEPTTLTVGQAATLVAAKPVTPVGIGAASLAASNPPTGVTILDATSPTPFVGLPSENEMTETNLKGSTPVPTDKGSKQPCPEKLENQSHPPPPPPPAPDLMKIPTTYDNRSSREAFRKEHASKGKTDRSRSSNYRRK